MSFLEDRAREVYNTELQIEQLRAEAEMGRKEIESQMGIQAISTFEFTNGEELVRVSLVPRMSSSVDKRALEALAGPKIWEKWQGWVKECTTKVPGIHLMIRPVKAEKREKVS